MSEAMIFTISLGITLLGLVTSYGVAKRRGVASGLRGAAWSTVPLAAALTGVTDFIVNVAFDPVAWAGVALAGLGVLLYLVSGVMLSKGVGTGGRERPAVGDAGTPGRGKGRAERRPRPAVEPPAAQAGRANPAADPDLAEIEDILRRRGIQ